MSGVQPINPAGGLEAVATQFNKLVGELQAREVTEIFKDDTGTRRVLLGKGKDGFYGLKTSPEGVDVYDAPNDQLVFNSDQNVFKIVASGTIESTALTVANPGVGAFAQDVSMTTLAHGLGYTPAIIAYVTTGSGLYIPCPNTFLSAATGGGTGSIWGYRTVQVDATNIYLQLSVTVSGTSYSVADGHSTVKYFLLQESVS